jgi:predicted O-linked N-acetylglucosamine transferase (SPINDLY family)
MAWSLRQRDNSVAQTCYERGVAHLRAERPDQAAAELERAVQLDPANAEFLKTLGSAQRAQGRLDDAVASYRAALQLAPDNAAVLYNLGMTLREIGRLTEAETHFRRVHELDPNDGEALFHLAALVAERGQLSESVQLYRKALALAPENPFVWMGLGIAYQSMPDQLEQSLQCQQKAVELAPDFAEAHCRIGFVSAQLGRYAPAMAAYRRTLELEPTSRQALNDLANLLWREEQTTEAMALHRRVLELYPDFAAGHCDLGNALLPRFKLDDAIACYRRAIEIDPTFALAHYNLGAAYGLLRNQEAALQSFEAALALQPTNGPFAMNLLSEMQQVCDWSRLDELYEIVRRAVLEQPHESISPFLFLSTPSTPEEQLRCAENCAQQRVRAVAGDRVDFSFRGGTRSKLRIGYLSQDFHEHATAYLMAELFELHDRKRFEVFGYSYGPDDGSPMRARLRAAFDKFVEIRQTPPAQAGIRIHSDEVDILVDLKGYTAFNCAEILALRPAPIQVNYLGYPGTMSGAFMDYIVADHFIAPPELAHHYGETIVRLPGSYQVNDRRRTIAPTPSREQLGLPEGAFVFCSFNQAYKITPDVFAVWMRLLEAVPGSVLWQLETSPLALHNLRREMAKRGVAPERLVGAPRIALDLHLGRLRAADLSLDTLPCNAHTTTSDALWAGVPLLTCSGKTFASRVAGSLLTAANLPELITYSLEEYEARALHLVRNRPELTAIRAKLALNRGTSALFDTPAFARKLEVAYLRMWDNHLHGGRKPIDL